MPGGASVYYTTAIVDPTPDHAATSIIATIVGVTVTVNRGVVRLSASGTFTPGADTTDVRLQWYRNAVAAAVPVGSLFTLAVNVVGASMPFLCDAAETPPAGLHTYNLAIIQTAASADGTVGVVFAEAIVGG